MEKGGGARGGGLGGGLKAAGSRVLIINVACLFVAQTDALR